jgi:methylenetetrahydrofolate dehydrogenase (NADP+)/methenyltetrahydrofolate cyclohydrolase
MELISGSQIAEEIKSALRVKNQEAGIIPQLEVVLVGENEESKVYVNLKEKAALSISARTSIRQLPASISKEGLLAVIAEANNDPAIDGIIIQLPLPQDLSPYQDEFLEAIKTEKDVDGFNPINRGTLIAGQAEFVSCAALACMEIINRYPPPGKNAVLVGDSFDLILPLAISLVREDFNVSVIKEYQAGLVQTADLLVVEKGQAGIVKGQDLREGMPVLCICGAYQLLGNNYMALDGRLMQGLKFFNFTTRAGTDRLIGNILIKACLGGQETTVVGFENHAGRTYFEDDSLEAFGEVLRGYGNNGEDKKEGIKYRHLIGTYLHGPLLPKNPVVADFFLKTMAQRKGIELSCRLDDAIELTAHEQMKNRLL